MADQSAGFRINWVTTEWLVTGSCGFSYHIRTDPSTDRDVPLTYIRKSVTGLPRDPQLAAVGEVRFGVDAEFLTLTCIHRTGSLLS